MKRKNEQADLPPEESAVQGSRATATDGPREDRRAPRAREPRSNYSRANPRAKPVRVIRSWPSVTNGQLVVLPPDREKRLLKGGFVERVD